MYTCMYVVLTEAVRRHRRFTAVGDDEIREACAKFFTGARDRRDETRPTAPRQERLHRHEERAHVSSESDSN